LTTSELKGVTNKWRRKHRAFLRDHDIPLKTLTLYSYEDSQRNAEFVKFFVLNARLLRNINLKFDSWSCLKKDGFYKKQETKLHMNKRASKCAKLKLNRCIDSNWVHLRSTNVEFLDLPEPFAHQCCYC
jgi:hypothetical protein